MGIIRERQSRHYLLFLCGFLTVLLAAALFAGWRHGKDMQMVFTAWEEGFVSSLLEQGVSVETIASAMKNEAVTEEGSRLVGQLGYTQDTSAMLLPHIRKSIIGFWAAAAGVAFFMGAVLMGAAFFFLIERDRLYQDAIRIIGQFGEGNFRERLPGKETGSLYRLFAEVNRLATVLQPQNETEHQAKEFLRDTISDISHQLKTPLAALTMYAEIIQGEPERADIVEKFSGKIMRALERMEQLIQSLLKVTRLDAGSIVFERDSFPAAEIIRRAAEPFFTRAEAEGKEILLKGNNEDCLFCDLQWTGEALGNLIKNALDHTEEGGRVCIEWERSPLMLRIIISDNGEGIPQEDIHHIFKRFYRSKKSSSGGIGLGLPLAKAIIEGQGGSLTVKSATGEGTVFTVSFLTEL